MSVVGPVNCNVCLLRSFSTGRDDFGDSSGHGCTRLFWIARRVEIQFHFPRRPRHARLGHLSFDASPGGIGGFFLTSYTQHELMITLRGMLRSPISHSRSG
jgi:hypothetical protein